MTHDRGAPGTGGLKAAPTHAPRDAYDTALFMLGRRAYTTFQIRQRLRQKQFTAADIQAALDRLTTAGLIDDTTLLEHLAERKARALRGLDPLVRRRRLYGFLARRGYGPDAIARALEATK